MYTFSDCSYISVTWIIVTWIFLYNRYMHIFWIQYMIISCITVLIWNSCYMDILFIDIRCVELSVTWKPLLISTGATSRVSHLLFPVILFSDTRIAHILLSVTCYMHYYCSWFIIIFNKYNMELGETWRLTRSCRVDILNSYLSHCRGW